MTMNRQIKLYSINLGMAKNEAEKQLYGMKYMNDSSLYNYKKHLSEIIKDSLGEEEWTEECTKVYKDMLKKDKFYNRVNLSNKRLSDVIKKQIAHYDKENIRKVDSKYFKESNMIAVFESDLTRILKLFSDEPTLDFMVIEVGNTDMTIFKQVINNGLVVTERVKVGEDENGVDIIEVRDNKYKFFSAGAGQTRQKKFLMIKQELWEKHEKEFMCGLTVDYINENGGMNINKFNAYLCLNNSASDVVEGFDIDRCIVVDDFTAIVNDEVDYITRDDEVNNGETTYKTKSGKQVTRKRKKTEWSIERKVMDVPIDFMDGAGICLPSVFKKNTQFRMAWFKGLLCPIDFKKYIKENNLKTKVTDIYGVEHDIIKDDVQVIFTKSQFKMWKYYKNTYDENNVLIESGWDCYKRNLKHYNRTFNICMEDEDRLKDMRINYQMLQTLTDMSDEEIEKLTKNTKDFINELHKNRKKQLEFLGATLNKKNRNYLQEIIRLYPEILTSNYIKRQLKDTITSYKKETKSGRVRLEAKRVFIIPDLIHFMSLLFGDGSDYALERNEVYFDIYKECDRLALLRSPHLSREWFIAKNTKTNDKLKYFKTNGIYVSAKDLMSKVLMADWDGDEALVVKDSDEQKWLLDLAERQMKDLRPLYYEMGGGDNSLINNANTYKSLKFVYEKSNIGKVSNTLTNIWSKDDCEDNMEYIKMLCAYNNWIIDSAKKLELPKLPKKIKEIMNNKTYPHFFQFAKGKKKSECRDVGNGVIDRICKSIDNIESNKFDYSKGFGKFNYKNLLNNKNISLEDNPKKIELIEFYDKLEYKTRGLMASYKRKYGESGQEIHYKDLAYEDARKYMMEYAKAENIDYLDLVDMIVEYGFKEDDMRLAFVFNVFGAVIINNINNNIRLSVDDNMVIICEGCGKRIKIKNPKDTSRKYCNECSKESMLKSKRNYWNSKK